MFWRMHDIHSINIVIDYIKCTSVWIKYLHNTYLFDNDYELIDGQLKCF